MSSSHPTQAVASQAKDKKDSGTKLHFRHAAPLKDKEKECDFFLNPTILSRLIQNNKFKAALQRLQKRGPAEAAVWVCLQHHSTTRARRPPLPSNTSSNTTTPAASLTNRLVPPHHQSSAADTIYDYRQLPLHMATEALACTTDQGHRDELELLVQQLVWAYPVACARPDHQGHLPLHMALQHGASSSTIAILLMAYPEAASSYDNLQTTDMYQHLLQQPPTFWQAAGHEAHLRLKHRQVPAADASIASTSVLASSDNEEDDEHTLETRLDASGSQPQPFYAPFGDICPPTEAIWEENLALRQALHESQMSNERLQRRVDLLMIQHNSDVQLILDQLFSENETLQTKVTALEAQLATTTLDDNTAALPSRETCLPSQAMQRPVTCAKDVPSQSSVQQMEGLASRQPSTQKVMPSHPTSPVEAANGHNDTVSSTDGSSSSGDVVLQKAIRLNGGQGLSPRIMELWQNLPSPSLETIDETTDGHDHADQVVLERDSTEASSTIDTLFLYLPPDLHKESSVLLPELDDDDGSHLLPAFHRDISDMTMSIAPTRWTLSRSTLGQ